MNIVITQADSKEAVALLAHMRQIFSTAMTTDGRIRAPQHMDHTSLLLAAASFRALLFDDTGKPLLATFLKKHNLNPTIETIESNTSMLLLSVLRGVEGTHVSDFLTNILFDEELRSHYALDETRELFMFHTDPASFEPMMRNLHIWAPTHTEDEELNTGIAVSNVGPSQLGTVCRKEVPVSEWGKVRIGVLKNKPIRRKTIILYVANKLGGVHYESTRLPSNSDCKADFRLLATAMDWDQQAVMHAGLVAVGMACFEFVRNPALQDLTAALMQFHEQRQQRLRSNKPIPKNNDQKPISDSP